MSRVERLVKKLVTLRFTVCPYCDTRVTVKNPRWKTVKCKRCGHRINVRFARTLTERVEKEMHVPLDLTRELVAYRIEGE